MDGRPVGRGFVSFCRLDKVQQPCEVRIVNGRFDVDARSLLGPGRYLVQCTAESPDAKHLPPEYDGTVTPGAKPPEDFKPENRPYLSDAWHSKSTLEVTLVLGGNRVDIAGPRDGPPSATGDGSPRIAAASALDAGAHGGWPDSADYQSAATGGTARVLDARFIRLYTLSSQTQFARRTLP
ncbi:MAG: hypothetical protein ACKOHG_18835 [Planctomycetia bacterium]